MDDNADVQDSPVDTNLPEGVNRLWMGECRSKMLEMGVDTRRGGVGDRGHELSVDGTNL